VFDVRAFFQQHGVPIPEAAQARGGLAPIGFHQLTVDNIASYVASDARLAALVGPAESQADWEAAEIGDGNINFVFVVKGPAGAVLIKQGLPFVRCIGESWPLTQVHCLSTPDVMLSTCPLCCARHTGASQAAFVFRSPQEIHTMCSVKHLHLQQTWHDRAQTTPVSLSYCHGGILARAAVASGRISCRTDPPLRLSCCTHACVCAPPQDRLRIEAESLQEMHRHCPQHVPEVYKFDVKQFVIAMQYLARPHVVLRYGILDGATYPHLAEHAAEQLARCLFHTSMHKLGSAAFTALADRFSNPEMCQLTEQVRC
jgi:hypothetical protein